MFVGDKRNMCACRGQYSAARQQNVANNFCLLWSKPVSQHCVGDILTEKKKNGRMKHVKIRLNGTQLEDLIWTGQVNVKNGTAADEVVKEQAKVIGQQMGVTDFIYKISCIFCSKK
jgi:hypothetical protein